MPTLSILIPIYNEENSLEVLVDKVLAAPLPTGVERELILVNDASTDGTAEVIERLCRRDGTIRAFAEPVNRGKGAAIRRAIAEMSGEFAIFQDADLEYDPNDYQCVLAPLLEGEVEAVYGSRFLRNRLWSDWFSLHRFANSFLTFLSNRTTGFGLTDMETCYKAFRSDLLKSIPLRSNRFGIEPEITVKLAQRGARVCEVPISYRGRLRSEGKKIGWKDGISAIATIVKFWWNDDSRPLKKAVKKQTVNHHVTAEELSAAPPSGEGRAPEMDKAGEAGRGLLKSSPAFRRGCLCRTRRPGSGI